jgi:hypothetical protein
MLYECTRREEDTAATTAKLLTIHLCCLLKIWRHVDIGVVNVRGNGNGSKLEAFAPKTSKQGQRKARPGQDACNESSTPIGGENIEKGNKKKTMTWH